MCGIDAGFCPFYGHSWPVCTFSMSQRLDLKIALFIDKAQFGCFGQ
jgi:hypothetical protein